jgi:uncharacterized protein (DUF433 family)
MPTSDTIETIPMTTGADGVIRVSGTRVTLDSILLAFNEGATPEEIARQYPTVPLADIYHLIGYSLGRTRRGGGPKAFVSVCWLDGQTAREPMNGQQCAGSPTKI